MANIVFPTDSLPGVRPQESGGRLINAYAEAGSSGSGGDFIIKRSAGLKHLTGAPGEQVHTRGLMDARGTLMWALDDVMLTVDSDLVVTERGELLGTEPITMAQNNHLDEIEGPQFVAVTENGAFKIFTGSAPIPYPGGILPPNPTSVCDFDGFFIFSYENGEIYASNLNTVVVNALSVNTEQNLEIRRVVRFSGRVFAMGDKWTAVYRNAGTSPFPLAREVTIPRGIVGTHAVAGWEPGWANQLVWAAEDFNVYRLGFGGYTPELVSKDPVSRDIEHAVRDGKRNFIEAFVYMVGRNAFWVLSCHDRWTWELNLSTGKWNERKTLGQSYWRGMKSVWIFDKWLVGDHDTGELHHIDDTYYKDDVLPLVWQVDSGLMSGFPMRAVIPRASFFITSAVGDYNSEPNPRVEISWSLDGGQSWGMPVLRRLGGPGEGHVYPSILSSGISRGQGLRYRLVVSDPVHVGLVGGIVEPVQRGPG